MVNIVLLRWLLSPLNVNINYLQKPNSLTVPAAMMKAPFFDNDLPSAVNFGSMGVMMAQEMTHSIDEYGIALRDN